MSLNYDNGPVIPRWTVPERLRKAREQTGLTQGQFAAETGISTRMVSAIESGERPAALKYLNLWQMATGVPKEWLETGSYTPREKPDPTGPNGPQENSSKITDWLH